jgi:hypothetical protein
MTTPVVLDYPLTMYNRDYRVDLVCLPLQGLDVNLGMNWLEFNRAQISCYWKTVTFLARNDEANLELILAGHEKKLMIGIAAVFMNFAKYEVRRKSRRYLVTSGSRFPLSILK